MESLTKGKLEEMFKTVWGMAGQHPKVEIVSPSEYERRIKPNGNA